MQTTPSSVDLVHELNNLLTVVLGSLEQLHRQPLNARGKAQLERAQWGVKQAGTLVQQVIEANGYTASANGVGGDAGSHSSSARA